MKTSLKISWTQIAVKSLLNRRLAVILTVVSMTLSLLLLMAVERVQRAAQDGFTQTISGVDLIVGARAGSLQLLLYSVFNMGQATQNITYETYQKWATNPKMQWTIPYSLGDGHRGFRVVGTNQDFFKYYKFRSDQTVQFADGKPFQELFDVVIGSDVAKELNYKIGDKVVVNHGSTTGDSMLSHDDKPFKVSGILKATGTPLDRAVYLSLEGLEAIHLDWADGSAPQPGKEIKVSDIKPEMVKPKSITSFFVRTGSRLDVLHLQRAINDDDEEALLAIIPGVVLAELWGTLGKIEWALKGISFLVMIVGFFTMLISLMSTLNERRREMAILRAVGARLQHILFLIMIETAVLLLASIISACVLKILLEWSLGSYLQTEFGLYLQAPAFGGVELIYIALMFVGGLLIGLIPALKASRTALKDGLTVQV